MTDAISAYPLSWPPSFRRTPSQNRTRGSFGAHTFDATRRRLMDELRLLKARSVVLSTNIPLRQDGFPYSTYKTPADTGVAIYFQRDKRNVCLACDRFNTIEINMHALCLTISNMRAIERYGASDFLDRAFTGFAALNMPARKSWWDVLELKQNATAEDVKAAYRRLALLRHPDHGGTADEWAALDRAKTEALQDLTAPQ